MHDDQHNSTRPAFGPQMSDAEAAQVAQEIIAGALREEQRVPTSTRFGDPSPVPAVGSALPVPQPGRAPMSQKAVDASALMLSAGAASLPIGAVTIGALLASGQADPVVIGLIAAGPTTLVLALSRLLRRGREAIEAAPPEHHHHYSGTVVQDHSSVTTNTTTKGLIARTRNDLNP